MAEPAKRPVTFGRTSRFKSRATEALAKLLIEKGLITREEFMRKLSRHPSNVGMQP